MNYFKRSATASAPARPPGTAAAPGVRRWPPGHHTPVLEGSAAIHALALAGCVLAPAAWPWWLGGIAANHVALSAAGLWPRSKVLGPNWTHLPEHPGNARALALTIDDGPDPQVTPRVLDLLDHYGVRATFFCIGAHARRHPGLAREIVARGHALENHTETHPHSFSLMGTRKIHAQIAAAQHTIADLTGVKPMFFRAPAGLRNPFLDPVLRRLDLRLASWTRRGFDTREASAAVVSQRLLDGLRGRDIVLLHDGNAARAADGEPVLLAVLPTLIEAARHQGLQFVTLPEACRSDATPASSPTHSVHR
jgi:peptidoglycan/xylan/chitin deacetylase (PgdA/CDA1 family)